MTTKPNLPNVSSSRGAPMGRRDSIMEPDAEIKFRVVPMRLDAGGYDSGGAYWGVASEEHGRMWIAFGSGPQFMNEMFIRAKTRGKAKVQVLAKFKKAKFYR